MKRTRKHTNSVVKGLWLSVPVCGISATIVFGNIQFLSGILIIPIILGSPMSLVGALFMMMTMGHGLSENAINMLTLIGVLFVFLGISFNGAAIRSKWKTNLNKAHYSPELRVAKSKKESETNT